MAQKNKEKYVPPEITRVVLRSEQAVLSPCSGGASDAMGVNAGCTAGGCKNGPAAGSDSGPTS
jgi:hypothetical protein